MVIAPQMCFLSFLSYMASVGGAARRAISSYTNVNIIRTTLLFCYKIKLNISICVCVNDVYHHCYNVCAHALFMDKFNNTIIQIKLTFKTF